MQNELSCYLCIACRRIFIFNDDTEDHKRDTGHERFQTHDFEGVFNKEAVNQLQLSLHQAIVASLSSLGERATNSILWYLKTKGVLIDAKNLDIRLFYAGLEEVIGPAADTIFEAIIKHLCIHYRITSGRKCEANQSDLHPVVKLQQLLKVIMNLGGVA